MSKLLINAVELFLKKEQDMADAWLYNKPANVGKYSDMQVFTWSKKRWGSDFTRLENVIRGERYGIS